MRKLYISLALVAACAVTATAASKLDNAGQMAVSQYKMALENPTLELVPLQGMPFELQTNSRGEASATVFIKMAPGVTADEIAAQGFEITTEIDDILIANASLADIDALSKSDLVQSMQMSRKVNTLLDVSRDAIGMTAIHHGEGLPQAYRGEGVIAGIFDSGMDPNHVAFREADETTPRIKKLWHFNSSDGSYLLFDTEKAIKGFTTDDNTDFHGTHTMNCMAGSFNGRPGKIAKYDPVRQLATVVSTDRNPYYGMAPAAEIAAACGNLYDDNIVGAVKVIVDYAKEQGKPAVVNLSLGMTSGSHDGQDLTAQALAKLGEEAIICIAAGNEGEYNNSIIFPATADSNSVKTIVGMPYNIATGILEAWASDGELLKVTPCIVDVLTGEIQYEYVQEGPTGEDNVFITSTYYDVPEYIHDDAFDRAFSRSNIIFRNSVDATTGRAAFYMSYDLTLNTYYNKEGQYSLALKVEGKPGQRIDIVNTSDYTTLVSFDLEGWTDGTNDLSLNSMGCSEKLLTVGAYNMRERWGALGRYVYGYRDNTFPVGELASYSSYGTTYDGRTYPKVCAPGSGIISAISYYYFNNARGEYRGNDENLVATYTEGNRVNPWDASQGTSMACPIVAGALTTWLQANPMLTTSDVIEIISRTSDNDEFTADKPIKAGYGKFNALAGLKMVLELSGIQDVNADKAPVLVSPAGAGQWNVFVAGAKAVDVKVYNMAGVEVARTQAVGNETTFDASALAKGVYVLSVNGIHSERIAVK